MFSAVCQRETPPIFFAKKPKFCALCALVTTNTTTSRSQRFGEQRDISYLQRLDDRTQNKHSQSRKTKPPSQKLGGFVFYRFIK